MNPVQIVELMTIVLNCHEASDESKKAAKEIMDVMMSTLKDTVTETSLNNKGIITR